MISGVESAFSTVASTYTLAATPGDGVFSNVFYTSFTVTWPANNPGGTRFEVSRSTTNDNFASTVSPWMVTLDALAPFRSPLARPEAPYDTRSSRSARTTFPLLAGPTLASPSP